MASPMDKGNPNDMEIEAVEGTPTTNAPFIPPAGVWDVGDIVRHGKDKWMILGSDQQWHEGKGPEDFDIDSCGFEEADFFRLNDHWSGYRKKLYIGKCYTGYQRWEEELLDAEFDKYRIQHDNEKTLSGFLETMKLGKVIQHEDEEALKKTFQEYLQATKTGTVIQHEDVKMLTGLLETMRAGKVMPTNVACFALGSFHQYGDKRASFEQLAVLLKFIELLGIPPNARKVMQDPVFSPGDARFLARLGFQTVMDPEGIDAVDEETCVFHIGGYHFIDQRIMDRPWPAVYINMGHKGQLLHNRSKIAQRVRNWYHNEGGPPIENWWDEKKKIVAIRKTYDHREIPQISSISDGMICTRLFWRKEVVGGRFQCFVDAGRLVGSLFSEEDFDEWGHSDSI
ncbi:hypothetical protein EAF04_004698 [Stromatinia cepivora]|nr:hypothetical protein EAF04_004698 [Stromatinia cepivora]